MCSAEAVNNNENWQVRCDIYGNTDFEHTSDAFHVLNAVRTC